MPKDVRGDWVFVQSNGPYVKMGNVDQDYATGNITSGEASYDGVSGPILDGRVSYSEISFRVPWSNQHVGRYTGHFVAGILTGFTYDEVNPASQANWVALDNRVFHDIR